VSGNLVLNTKTFWQKGNVIIRLAKPTPLDLDRILNFRKIVPITELDVVGTGGGIAGSLLDEDDEENMSRKIMYEMSNRKIVLAARREIDTEIVLAEGIFSKDKVDSVGILPEYRGKRKPEYMLSYALLAVLLSLSRTSKNWKIRVSSQYTKIISVLIERFQQLAKDLDLEITIEKSPFSPLIVDVELSAKDEKTFDKKVIMLLAKRGWRKKRFK